MRPRIFIALVGCLGAAAPARAERPEWESLRGVPICEIRIEPGEVFDRSRQGEDHVVFEWANWIHIRTRPYVIRREYRQEVGDPFDPARAEECERNLRGLGIFQDVRLDAVPGSGGVQVAVHTVDRWSTQVLPVIRSQGGVNQLGLAVGEHNILGLGFEVGGSAIYSNDVSEASIFWRDPRLFGSRWDGGVDLRSDDLGRGQFYHLTHPFYADDVPWTADMRVEFADDERRLFESGTETHRYVVHEDDYEGAFGLHSDHLRPQRWALFAARRHVRGDVQDDIAAVGLTWAIMRREFDLWRHLDQVGADEEVARGWSVQLGAGADVQALGAAVDRPFWRIDASWAERLGEDALVGVTFGHHGFERDGRLQSGRAGGECYGFWQPGGVQTLAWHFGADAVLEDLPWLRFNLGSDDRLRGYPARALNGTRVLYGSLEQRLSSSRRLLFLHAAAVAFVDAAAAWDRGETLTRSHARLGAGVGLRIGTDPAGSNVTRLDLGFGSGSVEVSLSSGSFFDVARGLGLASTRLFR